MDNDTQFDSATIRMAYFALLLSGRKGDNLELAVAQEMLKLERLTAERSLPSMIGRSVRIAATINSIEFEESSKRYLIKFQADNGEKEEKIRSERVDSNHKSAVKKIWERDLVGHRVLLFKYKDRVGSKEAPNGYRIAPYCIDHGKAEQVQMKRTKLEDLDLKAIVESELENRNCDGLYSPCNRCEHGCSRTGLFSCGKACADCRPGLQHPGTSDLKIVSHDEYREIIDRIEAEHKRHEEKLRAEAIEKRKAERLEAKQIKEENALKKKQARAEKK